MRRGMRGPLRLLAGAFAITAALVFLQTLVLRAVPYDASWFGALSSFFRATFIAADAGAIVALVMLSRAVPAVFPFTITASIVLGLSVGCGLLGFVVSAIGGVEPVLSFGATVLVVLALAAVLGANPAPDRRRPVLMAAALSATVIVLVMRIGSAMSRDAPNMILAWLRWAFAVAQPASLAAVAFLVSRAREANDPSADALAGAAGGAAHYRAAGEAMDAAPRPDLAAPSAATIEPLRVVFSGIGIHRTGFIVRACCATGLIVFAIVGVPFLAALIPLVSGATAIVIAVGLSRQRALATFGGGASMRVAFVCFVAAAVGDLGGLLVLGASIAAHSFMEVGALAFVAATVFNGLGIFFASRAHERAGDLLYQHRLAARARWTQSLIVALVSSTLAVVASASHQVMGRDHGPPIVALMFGLLGVFAFVDVIIMHVMTLNEASNVVGERLAKAVAAASDPNANAPHP